MIILPNGCSCSELSIHPKNWKTKKALLTVDWRVQYRFYDPAFKDDPVIKGRKLVFLRCNKYTTLQDRQEAIRALLDNELNLLKNSAYNPITNTTRPDELKEYEIHPSTPFIKALKAAREKLTVVSTTLSGIDLTIRRITKAAIELRMNDLAVCEVSRRHIRYLLDRAQYYGRGDSSSKFNKMRTYIMILFDQLIELEATENDPVSKIKKKKVVKKIRETPTIAQRRQISEHLKKNYYAFWRFVQIFFHSGARVTELLAVKVKDVDLVRQVFKVTIRKGRNYKEVEKTIKNVALPLWQELTKRTCKDYLVFSEGLNPGKTTIRREQIVRRWNKHVKEKLHVTADLYSLKHLHTSEVIDQLGDQAAAAVNSHASTEMNAKVYDINRSSRQHERIKNIANEF